MAILRLDAVEFVDLAGWRWVLTDEASEELAADHEVRLDASCWQFDAFADLVGYLSWHAAPDRRTQDEARIAAELGEWIGSKVLGPVAAAMVRAAPVTVRVVVPEGAAELLARPLELAHVGGKPLAAQGVTLVMETGRADSSVSPVGERLRVHGLFSMPEGGQALNLHRERQSLVRLMKEIVAVGKAADIRVLQYGVTRDRLRDVLADGEGWDIIHVSGHGSPGQLLLETDEGKSDRVTAAQLAELLDSASGRLKLVTISACWSAAVAVAAMMEQSRLLIVIDNAESLLSQDGRWRYERWDRVLGALTAHTGLGRLVLTSRRVPVELTRLGTEAVDALSADESLLLTLELPHVRALSHGEIPGIDRHMARRLARHVLNVAQGHPKLLELAEGQAADPQRLTHLVEAGGQAWRARGGLPDGFFTTGETTVSDADYLHVLAAWTKAVTDTLAPGERNLFWFLCCLEEPDRERHMVDGNWADLWTRLERDGQPPQWDQALASLIACGLTCACDGTRDYLDSYPIHPGVAAAGRTDAGRPFQEAVDEEAATYWVTNFKQASEDTVDGRRGG